MAFAGLWSIWRDPTQPDAEPTRTFTIITTTANATLEPIHDRMPVILARVGVGDAGWPRRPPIPGSCSPSCAPRRTTCSSAIPVSKRVNNARNEGPDLVVPLGPLGREPGSPPLL